jgi:preprotein translocase subunit SecD
MLTVTVVLIVGWFAATLAGSNRPALGLDLQGGTSIVLAPVKGSDLTTLDTAVAIIRSRANGCAGVSEPDVSRQGDNVVIDMPGAKNVDKCKAVLSQTAELRFRPVQGTVPYNISDAPTTTTPKSTTTVKGQTTTTVKGQTSTTAPGTTAPATTSTTIKGQSLAPERAIDAEPIVATRQAADAPSTTAGAKTTATTVKGATTTTTVPAGQGTCMDGKLVTPRAKDKPEATVILPDRDKTVCYLLGPTVLNGKNVGSADKVVNPENGEWIVNVHFKNNDFVTKVAQPYVNKQVAIVLDQEVVSAPTINPGITGQNVTISGNFTEKDAGNLALVLRYGSLPLQFVTQTSATVSPSLGKDQLRAGIIAGVIGLALVALYMIFFYRLLGLVVWVGLGLTGMTFFSLVSWLSAHQGLTMTLAGVTGIIVSVGVTVDSYVVFFERLKDEVRTGKTVRSSLDVGFHRAFRTILAADLVSLLGAAVLYTLAAGSVRGFAYFLGLSTLLDLLLAYTFMWPAVGLLARRSELVRLPGFGIAAGLDTPGVRA